MASSYNAIFEIRNRREWIIVRKQLNSKSIRYSWLLADIITRKSLWWNAFSLFMIDLFVIIHETIN